MAEMTDDLPEELWALPEDLKGVKFGADKDNKGGKTAGQMYASILLNLRNDAEQKPGFGTVETIMLERTTSLYVRIRAREIQGAKQGKGADVKSIGGFEDDKSYKEHMQLLLGWLGTIQRAGAAAPNEAEVKDGVLLHVRDILKGVVETLPEEWQDTVSERIQMEFDGVKF